MGEGFSVRAPSSRRGPSALPSAGLVADRTRRAVFAGRSSPSPSVRPRRLATSAASFLEIDRFESLTMDRLVTSDTPRRRTAPTDSEDLVRGDASACGAGLADSPNRIDWRD